MPKWSVVVVIVVVYTIVVVCSSKIFCLLTSGWNFVSK